ncbi:MAG: hypothetical protein ACK48U_17985 [Planctomyces sp.]
MSLPGLLYVWPLWSADHGGLWCFGVTPKFISKFCRKLADSSVWAALTIQRTQVGTMPPVTSLERQQKDRLAVA